jgi:beta-lactamase class A
VRGSLQRGPYPDFGGVRILVGVSEIDDGDGSDLGGLFGAVGVQGHLHVRDVDDEHAEICWGAVWPVVLASVANVLLMLEFCRQAAQGQIDPAERVRIGAADRLGGLGTAACRDDVDMSWRDLALFTMMLGDDTAADVLFRRVGLDNVQALATRLHLVYTEIRGGPRYLLQSTFDEVGAADEAEFARRFATLSAEQIVKLPVVDTGRTSAGSPKDMTRLLSLIWRDEAGPAAACAQVRELMGRQAAWHRLAAAFDEDVSVTATAGTVLGVRSEIGVIAYPDGRRYAAAVFTDGPLGRRADIDAVIGRAARHAVEQLRA